MNRRWYSILLIIAITQLQIPSALAETEKKPDLFDPAEPSWTLKIPKGRYPCLCDTPPSSYIHNPYSIHSDLDPRYEMSEVEFQLHIEQIIFSRLKLLIEHKYDRSGLLSCEVKYKLTKNKSIKDVEVLVHSTDANFDKEVLKALESLNFGFVGYPHKLKRDYIALQSIVTPDGVYPGSTGKVQQRNIPLPASPLAKPLE